MEPGCRNMMLINGANSMLMCFPNERDQLSTRTIRALPVFKILCSKEEAEPSAIWKADPSC